MFCSHLVYNTQLWDLNLMKIIIERVFKYLIKINLFLSVFSSVNICFSCFKLYYWMNISKYKSWNFKTSRTRYRNNSLWSWAGKDYSGHNSWIRKEKIDNLEFIKSWHLFFERHLEEIKWETTDWENIFQHINLIKNMHP